MACPLIPRLITDAISVGVLTAMLGTAAVCRVLSRAYDVVAPLQPVDITPPREPARQYADE